MKGVESLWTTVARISDEAPHRPWCTHGRKRPRHSAQAVRHLSAIRPLLQRLFEAVYAGEAGECRDDDKSKAKTCGCLRCALATVETYEAIARGGDYAIRDCDVWPRPLSRRFQRTANGIADAYSMRRPFPHLTPAKWFDVPGIRLGRFTKTTRDIMQSTAPGR